MSDDAPVVRVKRFSRSKRPVAEPAAVEAVEEPQAAPPPTPMGSMDTEVDGIELIDDDFLDDLKTDRYVEPEAEPPAPRKSRAKKKVAAQPMPAEVGWAEEFGDLFSEKPTPILGKDRRELLTRIAEYRSLFPELKSFKIKANATDQQLEEAISEMDTIVSCGSTTAMLDEFVLTVIQAAEAFSARTEKLDITGTAEALRGNPEFHRLAKMVWIKYRVFSAVPPEYQLALVVGSTALMCRAKNVKKKELQAMLSQPLAQSI